MSEPQGQMMRRRGTAMFVCMGGALVLLVAAGCQTGHPEPDPPTWELAQRQGNGGGSGHAKRGGNGGPGDAGDAERSSAAVPHKDGHPETPGQATTETDRAGDEQAGVLRLGEAPPTAPRDGQDARPVEVVADVQAKPPRVAVDSAAARGGGRASPGVSIDASTQPVGPKHPRVASVRLPVGAVVADRGDGVSPALIRMSDADTAPTSPGVTAPTLPRGDAEARPTPIRLAALTVDDDTPTAPPRQTVTPRATLDAAGTAAAPSDAPALAPVAWSDALVGPAEADVDAWIARREVAVAGADLRAQRPLADLKADAADAPEAGEAGPLAALRAGDAPFVAVQVPGQPIRVLSRRAAVGLLEDEAVEGMTVLALSAGEAEGLLADIAAAEHPLDLAQWFADHAAVGDADRAVELMTIRVQRDAIRDRVWRVLLGEGEPE